MVAAWKSRAGTSTRWPDDEGREARGDPADARMKTKGRVNRRSGSDSAISPIGDCEYRRISPERK